MAVRVEIVADSISPEGDRLTTMQCTFHRFILSEVNTHRVFSRNSASSRAIPIEKVINQVLLNPAVPITYRRNQPGMVGGEELDDESCVKAQDIWIKAGDEAVESAKKLLELGVHKSIANRILEPFMWHTAVITSTDWDNFFHQRISPDAQPEINDLAEKMQQALRASVPQRVDYGGWHLPYVTAEEFDMDRGDITATPEVWRRVSVARVAGVSYNRLGKTRELQADLNLYDRLLNAKPPHWSPFEHVATPYQHPTKKPKGNFNGWNQLRHILDN